MIFNCPYHCGHPAFYSHPIYFTPVASRQFPKVDASLFNQSAIEMENLMKDAQLLIKKLAASKDLDQKIMSAAQQSNNKEVDRLIQSTGIQSTVETSFTPDGLHLNFIGKTNGYDCCHLTIALKWR
ncbi:hypothetical protein JOC78_000297 [Bacillus ectoiniformans]|uniref:hypothetical protein n=1 Tax=Bacillus ectoiniformans TaxID=1494429 RepID=UPI00195E2A69|nr:hypothetical protein [Bacillus ectoiniformans]MBM7647376.1 hypothetical protein [Bacillus ectoiniformans]